jgi:phosphoesterase RecJ-like protein
MMTPMMGPLPREVFLDAERRLAAMKRPLLISHARPDGDAFGALLALRRGCRSAGVEPLAVQFDPTPPRYVAVRQHPPLSLWGQDAGPADLAGVDGVVVLDTCSYGQLEPVAEWLRTTGVPKIVVDHHVTRDPIADIPVIDESASATCLILHDWAMAAGWTMDPEMCAALFIGISTDTGWFRHSNTDARTLHAAADLVQRGVSANDLYQALYQTDSAARVRLMGALLASMELHAADRAAVLKLTKRMREDAGARMSDAEDMINEPLRITDVRVCVLLAEQDDGTVRASFRSKPAVTLEERDYDVAALAARFGGGGHRRASGAKLKLNMADAHDQIVAQVLDMIHEPSGR